MISKRTEEGESPIDEAWAKKIFNDTRDGVSGEFLLHNEGRIIRKLQKDAIVKDARVEGWIIELATRKGQIAFISQGTARQVPNVDLAVLAGVLSRNKDRSDIALYRELVKRIPQDVIPAVFDAVRSTAASLQYLLEPSGPTSRSRPDSFIIRAQELEARGSEEASLDLIYDAIDELLRKGSFAEVDRILQEISVSELSVDLLLALLTSTLPAADRLQHRDALFSRIQKSLRDRDELDDTLLLGLEG